MFYQFLVMEATSYVHIEKLNVFWKHLFEVRLYWLFILDDLYVLIF